MWDLSSNSQITKHLSEKNGKSSKNIFADFIADKEAMDYKSLGCIKYKITYTGMDNNFDTRINQHDFMQQIASKIQHIMYHSSIYTFVLSHDEIMIYLFDKNRIELSEISSNLEGLINTETHDDFIISITKSYKIVDKGEHDYESLYQDT